ncbi:MAG TPA: alpha/beta hydrolase [Candidatus Deferrimicrobium sp.]|nr:alpha/beta hydrolase [Candidatus Deferrimicrobium sp.]
MFVWIMKANIIILFFLIALPVVGNQDTGAPRIGKAVSADGVEIAYTSQGSGETTIIFIHGGFADRSFWSNQVGPFSEKYRVIALDLAGHGESGKNRQKWNLPAFAQDVRAVMEKENTRRAILVGNSLGGPVALETTLLLPEKIIGIVAVDTFQDFAEQPPAGHFQKIAESFRSDFNKTMQQLVRSLFHNNVDPKLYAQIETKMLKISPEMAAELLASFETYDEAAAARKVTQPIRCINGDLFPTQVEKNRNIHPDFNAVIIPHTGHFPMLEQPELFNRRLTEILETFKK